MKAFIKTVFIIILCTYSASAIAQTSVTFNINLKPQLEDSTFIPGKDKIVIEGNLFPFQRNKSFELEDSAPVDSMFSVVVEFSSTHSGKSLEYRFIIQKEDNADIKEMRPRIIELEREDMDLNPHYFNAYAF